MIKAVIIILFIICILFSIVELGLSFSQITDSTTIDKYPLSYCDSNLLSPFRFYVLDKDNYVFCGWSNRLSAERIIVYFINIWTIFGLIYTVVKKKTVYYMMSSIFLFMCGCAAMYTSIYDSIQVHKTSRDCEEYVEEAGAICDFKYFYATVALNYVTSIIIILTSCTILKFRSKLFDLSSTSSSSPTKEFSNFTNQPEDNYSKFKPESQQKQQLSEEGSNNNNNENNNGAVLLGYDPYPSYTANSSI